MTKQTAQAPLKVKGFPDEQVIELYVAHNLTPHKLIPPAAKGRNLSYDGDALFDQGKLVTRFAKRGKQRLVFASSHGQRTGAWGRPGTSIASRVSYILPVDCPKIETRIAGHNMAQAIGNGEWLRLCRDMAETNVDAPIVAWVAKLYRVPLAKVYANVKAPSGGWRYNQRRVDNTQKTALDLLHYYTPQAKAEREREAREAREQARRYWLRRQYVQPFYDAFATAGANIVNLEHVIAGKYETTYTTAEILGMLGVDIAAKPSPRFKYLNHNDDGSRYAKSGPWPAHEQWAPSISPVQACMRGYHLTDYEGIALWRSWGAHLYLAEGAGQSDGVMAGHKVGGDRKIAYETARTTRYLGEVTEEKLRAYRLSHRDAGWLTELQEELDAARAVHAQAALEYNLASQGY